MVLQQKQFDVKVALDHHYRGFLRKVAKFSYLFMTCVSSSHSPTLTYMQYNTIIQLHVHDFKI